VTNLAHLGKPSSSNDKSSALKVQADGSVIIPIRVEDPELPTPMEVETTSQPAGGPDPEPPEGGPAPRHLSELELKVIYSAFTRWHKEVEEEIAALKKALQVSYW
jgi:hypothetical protein